MLATITSTQARVRVRHLTIAGLDIARQAILKWHSSRTHRRHKFVAPKLSCDLRALLDDVRIPNGAEGAAKVHTLERSHYILDDAVLGMIENVLGS
jgi:hypothetical protein